MMSYRARKKMVPAAAWKVSPEARQDRNPGPGEKREKALDEDVT